MPWVKFRPVPYGEKSIACLLPFTRPLRRVELERLSELVGLRASFQEHQLILGGVGSGIDWVEGTLTALRWLQEHVPREDPVART